MVNLATYFPQTSEGWKIGGILDKRPGFPPLLAGRPFDSDLTGRLCGLDGPSLFRPVEVKDAGMAEAARAGLLLWNDDFEASHEIAQGLDNPTGSYWHALCHRREGRRGSGLRSNLDNARYWFRRVGSYSTNPKLYDEALIILQENHSPKLGELQQKGAWDPGWLVDWVQSCEEGGQDADRPVVEAIQSMEMRLLLEHCTVAALLGA